MIHRRRLRPRLERALGDRQRRVGDDQLGVDHPLEPEPVAALAAAVRGVEGEDPRLELGHRGAALQAGELLREDQHLAALAGARPAEHLGPGSLGGLPVPRGAVEQLDLDHPLGELRGGLQRLGEALAHPLLHHQPVDDDRDVVLVLLVELDLLVEPAQLAVDHRARVALGAHLLEQLPVLALALADHRRQDHEPGALRERHHVVGDLLDRLAGDRRAALEAVRLADPRPEQAQVVVDLGHRADRRARVARGRLLVDRDRRRQALDRVHVGLLHLAEELARVGRQRLDVAALALGVDRVEGEARLARAREPGDHDQRLARQRQVDALEVVRASAGDDDLARASHGEQVYGGARSAPAARKPRFAGSTLRVFASTSSISLSLSSSS